eukprot:4085861-Alexandrium_andersonii.AAC.1
MKQQSTVQRGWSGSQEKHPQASKSLQTTALLAQSPVTTTPTMRYSNITTHKWRGNGKVHSRWQSPGKLAS